MEGALQQTVGDSLKAYRRARGLTQEAFAEVFGWTHDYMGKLERGKCNLTLRSLEYIASRIELDPIVLLQPTAVPALPGKRTAGGEVDPTPKGETDQQQPHINDSEAAHDHQG